jgi:hypothetical protein
MIRKSTQAIIVHHTVTNQRWTTMAGLRGIFKQRFGVNYVGYNLVIFHDGSVKTDIGDYSVGIHNNLGKYHNLNSVGVAVVGDFTKDSMTRSQEEALRITLDRLRGKYGLGKDRVFGHQDFKATACPGRIQDWLKTYKTTTPPVSQFPKTITVVVPKLFVRSQPTSKSGLAGTRELLAGNKFVAVSVVYGENVSGNNVWLKSSKGNYVWSGGTNYR